MRNYPYSISSGLAKGLHKLLIQIIKEMDLPTTEVRYLELVAAGPDQKNWRGIGIALLVIIIVCALIVAAILLLTPGDKGFNSKKARISLEEVIKGQYSYRRFNGTWISDYEYLYRNQHGAIGLYNIRNNSEEILMPNTTVRQYPISTYSLSPDRLFLLLALDMQRVFRYTFRARYMLYNISEQYATELFPQSPKIFLQYAAWGPTGNQLVYVNDNDVYYLSDVTAEPLRLTSTGVEGIIFNGVPDWVYEEEVLATSSALWWSPNGKRLCFATFNDTDVDVLQFPYYGAYSKVENVYPELINLRYPKAGKKNPTVTLWVADLESSRSLSQVEPPKEYKEIEYYFTDVQWVESSAVSVVWLKRSQNSSIISICRENDAWACKKNLQVETPGRGWLDLSKAVISSDSKTYFMKLSHRCKGCSGGFRHVAAIDVKNGNATFLTEGKYDIVALLGHDLEKKTVYYITTLEGKPGQRHIYGVTDMTHQNPKNLTCLTCDIGSDCLFNDATFSPQFTYYILECLGPGIPRIELRYTDSNKIASILDNNSDLRELVANRAMPQIKNLQVPTAEGDYFANVRLYLPPSLQEDEITKYPMLVEVYGGPGTQMVNEKFNVNWGSYLASKKNIIYVKIDGRGSGYQGDRLLYELYHKLGTVEVADQIYVTRYLKEMFSFIDGKHIAIFGWSYGGYVSALALSNEETVFTCGISVAPVTSWLYYDSVYTERYMGKPEGNELKNYQNSDVMHKAITFKGKKYLLVHGTADDNVHWQQSMMLAKALTDSGVLFRMQVYPDENHALGHVKLHLYQTMDDFLDHCFSDNYKDDASYQSSSQDSER